MWLSIPLPTFDNEQAVGRLVRLHASLGSRLEPGDVLADVRIDLSAGIARDCPPVTTCRILLREPAWLREVPLSTGKAMPAGSLVALLSTEPHSAPDVPSRQARTTIAAIVDQDDWWSTAG